MNTDLEPGYQPPDDNDLVGDVCKGILVGLIVVSAATLILLYIYDRFVRQLLA